MVAAAAYVRAAWNKISLHYAAMADAYRSELAPGGPEIDDVAFLGFEMVGTPTFYKDKYNVPDGRLLVRRAKLRINTDKPHFIAANDPWRDRIVALNDGDGFYHPTRREVEGGKPVGCLMLGGNVLLYGRGGVRDETVLYVHQRDNLPSNPHKLCFSPPGGNVSERPALTLAKELREELILLKRLKQKHYEVTAFRLPVAYGILSMTERRRDVAGLSDNLPRALVAANIIRPGFYDGISPVAIKRQQLQRMPEMRGLEGSVAICDQHGEQIDQVHGIVIYTPKGNKIGVLAPVRMHAGFYATAGEVLAVDGERIPELAAQGGRPVKTLTMAELDEACARGEGEPLRALDLLKAAHQRIRLNGVAL